MLSMKQLALSLVSRHLPAFAVIATLSGCASHLAQVPPRIDLARYEPVGLVAFSADPAKTTLGQQATQQFADALLASQSGFELLELGPADSAVARLLAQGDAPAAAQEIGRQKQLTAVFFGQLITAGPTPSGHVSDGGSLSVTGTVSAELNVRLLSASTGGTLWRSSGTASQSVGNVSMSGGRLPSISAADPNAAYSKLVNDLVGQVTTDFRPTWVKQK
jgi:hypothetical protein